MGDTALFSILAGSVIVIVWVVIPIWRGGAFWVPACYAVVREMLQLAEVKPDDLVIDLGSGDGRIPLLASQEFGARATGVEINFFLVWLSKLKGLMSGTKRVRFIWQDIWRADVSDADVITLFLYDWSTLRLGDHLLSHTKPDVRVVSHLWRLGRGWRIVAEDVVHGVRVYKKA